MNIPSKLVAGDEVSIRKVNEIIDCLRMLQPQSSGSGGPTVTPNGTVYPDSQPVTMPGIPGGGEEYQVLTRNSSGAAVWDWVRAHD